MIALSGKMRKAADRVGGIELMIPWPDGLPAPANLSREYERDTSPTEDRWVRAQLGDLMRLDLVCVRTQVAVTRRSAARPLRPYLAAIIISRRWVGARGAPQPMTMWGLTPE